MVAMLLPLQGCATFYSAKAIDAQVVDADTHQPLESVNIVVHWALKYGLEGGGSTDFELMETVTDKDGRFHIPAWGPTHVPLALSDTSMRDAAPEIIMFKAGYGWGGVDNYQGGNPNAANAALVLTSIWGGKTIPLKRFDGDLRLYARLVGGVLTGVSYGHCNWKKIPKMMAALNREAADLNRKKLPNYLPTFSDLEGPAAANNCGSVEEFFKDY